MLRREEEERKNRLVKEAYGKLQEIKNKLMQLTSDVDLPTTEAAYQTALDYMRHYLKSLQDLELAHKDQMNLHRTSSLLQGELKDLMADVDELKGELNVLDGDLKKWQIRLQQVQQRLEELGAEEIRARMTQVMARLKAIRHGHERMELVKATEGARHAMEDARSELAAIHLSLTHIDKLYNSWQIVLLEDLKSGFVVTLEEDADTGETGLLKKAGEVLQSYGYLLQDRATDRGKVEGRLNQVFYQEQGFLVEYRLTQEQSPEAADDPETEDLTIKARYEQLRQRSRKIILLMEYRGKKVSIYYVLEQMDKDIELQKVILSEKDRELYEEIIMNSVGRVIRRRINRAKDWARQITELMEQRDTSPAG